MIVKTARGKTGYRAEWRDAGGVRRRRVLSSEKRTAERILADIIRQRDIELAGLGGEDRQELEVEELRGRYLANLECERSEGHVVRVRGCLELVLDFVQAKRIRDLSADAVLSFRAMRVQEGVANSTTNKEVGALQAMLNWGMRAGLIAQNPIAGVRPLPTNKGTQKLNRRALSESEIRRLLAAARGSDAANAERMAAKRTITGGSKGKQYGSKERSPRIPQTPMWTAFLETGARFRELTLVRWADVDSNAQTITLRADTTKNHRSRKLPISEALARCQSETLGCSSVT